MKILIEVPPWLGDTVITTPTIENLIHSFPDAKITLFDSFISTHSIKLHPNAGLNFFVTNDSVPMYVTAAYNIPSVCIFGPTNHTETSQWVTPHSSIQRVELAFLSLENKNEVFILKRDNYFLDKKVNHSGWGKDFLVRIYNKNRQKLNENLVHEKILLTETSKKTCFFFVVLVKSFFAFIKTYFLDRYKSFVIALFDANGKLYRHSQRYINCKQ